MLLCRAGLELALASAEDADYVLVEVKERRHVGKPTVSFCNVRGEVLICLKFAVGAKTFVYALSAYITGLQRKARVVVGATMLAKEPLVVYENPGVELALGDLFGYRRRAPEKKAVKSVVCCAVQALQGKDLTAVGSWARSKVTGAHHTLLRPEEVVSKVRGVERRQQIALVLHELRKYDETEAFASGVLLWAASADIRLVRLVAGAGELWTKDHSLAGWLRRCKRLTLDLKSHHHYDDLPLTQLFELHVLVNRGLGEVDWRAERENRLVPNVVRLPSGQIYEAAKRMFTRGRSQGFRYRTERWKNFWARRWASTPSGSVHSQHEEDAEYISKERMERNKQYTVTKMPDCKISKFLERRPEVVAWPSEKYEWGKNRAIYGTDLTSYVLTDYAMPAIEESLGALFPIGSKASESYVAKRVELAGMAGIGLCFDYEDFNSQHSLQSMTEVLRAFSEVYGSEMHPEQRAAMDWVIDSSIRQVVEDREEGSYQSRGTLLSGWRLTTVVNTVLNRAYLEAAGCTDLFIDSVHNGDDVLAYVPDAKTAGEVLRRARVLGIRAQPAKCSLGSIEEFLRVDRAAADKTGSQYLSRACATAVHARAESSEPETYIAAVRAQDTRLSELEERGADVELVKELKKNSRLVIAEAFGVGQDYIDAVDNTHMVHGGLCEDEEVEPKYIVKAIPNQLDEERVEEHLCMPGVRAYAQYLANFFGLGNEVAATAAKAVAKATLASVSLTRRTSEVCMVENRDRAKVAQRLMGVCSKEYSVAARVGKARLAGLPAGRLSLSRSMSMAAARIKNSDDPVRTMSIIF